MKFVPARTLVFVLLLTGCEAATDKARRLDAEMVAEAKRAAAEESMFVADSMKFDSTFTTMPVDSARVLHVTELDDEGGSNIITHFFAFSSAKVCRLSKEKFVKLAPGDTIHCQWADKVEQ